MRCERPIDVSVQGARRIERSGSVPFYGRASFLVPCGKCFACKSRRKSQATLRMDFEKRYGHVVKHKDGTSEVVRFKHAFFATLTYASEFLPYSWDVLDRRTGELVTLLPKQDDPVLFPYHLQNFFKRLRRYYDIPCSWFAVGEYGDSFDRPHYHVIFYSDYDWKDTLDMMRHAWSVECPKSRVGSPGSFEVVGKYRTHRLSMGRVNLKAVNMRRIRYCAKYIVKDNNSNLVVPKFARWSKGLGSAFIESELARQTRQSRSLYAFSVDGKKCSLGRYFSHRLFTKSELEELSLEYLNKELPPDEVICTPAYQVWCEEKYVWDSLRYDAWKMNQKNPLLSYF